MKPRGTSRAPDVLRQFQVQKRDLEQARDRYADLYDFAPIGYVSLDGGGTITDINFAGAALLGHPREFLAHTPFESSIIGGDLACRRFLLAMAETPTVGQQMDVHPHTNADRVIRLIARPVLMPRGVSRLLVAMVDVTDERRREAERVATLEREQRRTIELADEIAARRQSEARVKSLLKRVVSIQEEERRRLSLNLHDHLGQQLTAIRLTVNALRDASLSHAQIEERVNTIDRIAARIDRDLETLALELRPAALDDGGLHPALETLVREWAKGQDLTADFHASPPDSTRVSPEADSQLYRMVQEALNNVAKHASASKVSVMLEGLGNKVVVMIEDNGRGFDVERARGRNRGLGLVGMEERAALIGARVEVESTPGMGTTVLIRVPRQL